MHVRHGLAAALAVVLPMALAAPASAVVSGTYDSGTGVLTITMTAAGDVGRVNRDGVNLRLNGGAVPNSPTVNNTDTISFVDSSGGGTTAVIDHSGGRFEPGDFDETGDSDEIEFSFSMGGGNDLVRVILLAGGQQAVVGNDGMNFNPLEDSPDDDVDMALETVESVEVQGTSGDDTVTGSGVGAGVSEVLTKPLKITGGGGDDGLTGGEGPDEINSQDGDNDDVISCRGGNDTATADFFDAVGTDCETINRPSTGGGGGTGGPPPPPGGTTTPPSARLAPGRLVFRRGRIGIAVTCPAASSRPCRGTVTIRYRGRVLGRRSYTAAPGRRVVVRVRLNARGRRLFRRRSRVRVVVRITSVGGSPQQRSVLVRRPGAR
jgi:hypothetical protein